MTLGGEQLRDARILAGYLDRTEFAALVGVSPRTLEGWEAKRGRVPEAKEALVRKVLADKHETVLDQVSNMDLLSALAARLAYYEERDRQLTEIERRLAEQDKGNEPTHSQPSVSHISDESRRIPTTTSVEGTAGPHTRPRKPGGDRQ